MYRCHDTGEIVSSPALKPVLRHSPFYFLAHWMLFCVNWRYVCQHTGENVSLPALKLVYDIRRFIFSTLVVLLSRSDVRLTRYGLKGFFTGFQTDFTSFSIQLLALSRFFCVDWRYGCQNMSKNLSWAAFEINFTPFTVFFSTLEVVCIDWMYHCQDTSENVDLTALKPVLRHSLFIF